ncbi:NAD(P)H-dependent oxidoreductase [Streptomyces carpaticus]|uniref:NADPH-dependent FMN reductase n=1 Tax=Streptomyces TaxID=1883 RepID=UPI001FF74743|nr:MULTISPECIES: NAD(P)H-dependent oxidoreductase [Streptomyces]MCK1812919.1 NAD(P)H-dependent oxidoreductase [Streptomyces sp. XM4011]UWM50303.1 NAD(P)H-dependent oxidoreductase [Streptomyces carpaticus]
MTSEAMRLEVITGSVREGRVGPVVASWFAGQARRHGEFSVGQIDVADYALSTSMSGSPEQATRDALDALSPRLHAADAYVVVTPEYNHSYPGALKNVIDWHFAEWHAKPVGLVSYGGISGGLRAAEHLRQVFAELHATTVRNTVSFHGHGPWDDFGGAGEEEAAGAARALLDQLGWWALTLREGRGARAYRA